MRRLLSALAIALWLGGCASGPPKCEKVSYNRHEIPPGPGVLSGPTGSFTLYRRGDVEIPQECHPSAHGRGVGDATEGQSDAADPGN